MPREEKLCDPWLVAVWPGMGGVAISAGYYLMAKLDMHLLIEFPASEFFDFEQIEVKDGLILTNRLPRSRLFLWKDPHKHHDLIVFIGEAQPPAKGGAFCRKLIEKARDLGVSRVFTFAAMATLMRPKNKSRVFSAAIDRETLADFERLGTEALKSGSISGLNGVLLATAANYGLPGGCLLGEIPQVFAQIPFPKASLTALACFARLAEIEIDFSELKTHATTVERTLEDFLVRMEQPSESAGREPDIPVSEGTAPPRAADRKNLERLFKIARDDRSRAYELKQELDRLGLFSEYEDQFLDLFK